MIDKDVEKAAALKRFEYSLLGKKLKAQTDIEKKQYQKLDDTDEFDGTINKNSTLKNYSKLDLIYDTNHSFFKYYHDDKKFDNLSFNLKYSLLAEFLNDIDKFSDLKPRKKSTKKKKTKMHDTVSELHNKFLNKYLNEYYDLKKETKEKLGFKFKPINLKLKDMIMVNCVMKHQMKIMMIIIIMKKKDILIYLTYHHKKVMKKK